MSDPDSSSNSSTDESSMNIDLIRVTDRTIHVSATDRRKKVNYTIQNASEDTKYNFVLLPLRQFERNLKVFDEDGTRLSYYPNDVVESILDKAKENESELFQDVESLLDNFEYQIYLQLPPDKPLMPGELRDIQLTFEQSEPVEFYRIWEPSIICGWYKHWERKFFRIPSFVADVERFGEMENDAFIVVVGASGYSTKGTSELSGTEPPKTIYENGLDDKTRVISTRLPAPDTEEYNYKMKYNLTPSNRSLMKALALFWSVSLIIGGGSIISYGLDISNILPAWMELPISTQLTSNLAQSVSTAIITATFGLVFALNADWTDRYRILSVVPLLFHGVAWFLWSL